MGTECLICGMTLKDYKLAENSEFYVCPQCGPYYLGDYVPSLLTDGLDAGNEKSYDLSKLKPSIFYYLRVIRRNHQNNNRRGPLITHAPNPFGKSVGDIDIPTLTNMYPDSLATRISMIMQLLGTAILDIGDVFERPAQLPKPELQKAIFFMPSKNMLNRQTEEIEKMLVKMEYIVDTSNGGSTKKYTFTPRGWHYLDELNKSTKGNTAFVAMSFSGTERMQKAEQAIRNAIMRAHYTPVVIKDKEHNNYIMPEIEYEITRARFTISDLTEHNNGAYYEAGYAKALGKEVVLSCEVNDFEKRQFDVAQISTIKWDESDMAAFEDALYNRIISTVGDYNSLPARTTLGQ